MERTETWGGGEVLPERMGGGGSKDNKTRGKNTRTQGRSGSQVQSFSWCSNHLPKRAMAGVDAAAAAAPSLRRSGANRCSRGQVAAPLFGTRAVRGAWRGALCLLLAGRRRALPPSSCTGSSAASNSGAATSSSAARRVRWACAGPRCPGGARRRGGRGGGPLGRGAGGSAGSAGARRGPESGAAEPGTGCPLPARGSALGAEAHAGPAARGAQQPYAGPGLPLNERAAANGSRRRR